MTVPDRLEVIALMNYHSKGAAEVAITAGQYELAGLLDLAQQYRSKTEWHNARHKVWQAALHAAPVPNPYE